VQILPEGKRRPEGATDVADALHKWFPGGGLQRQREVFQVAAAEPLDLAQLGTAVLQVPVASPASNGSLGAVSDGGIAVYRHRLSETNSYVKVRSVNIGIVHVEIAMATPSACRHQRRPRRASRPLSTLLLPSSAQFLADTQQHRLTRARLHRAQACTASCLLSQRAVLAKTCSSSSCHDELMGVREMPSWV
jgi:hypothetical protein